MSALRFEIGALRPGPGSVRTGVTGVGDRAKAGLAALIERHRPRGVVGIGFCGGLGERARRGAVAIPAEVVGERGGHPLAFTPCPGAGGRIVSVRRIAADPHGKARLAERFAADYVDQESYGWAQAAAEAGVALAVVRVVLDGPGEFLPTWRRPASWPGACLLPARAWLVRRILGEAGRRVLCECW